MRGGEAAGGESCIAGTFEEGGPTAFGRRVPLVMIFVEIVEEPGVGGAAVPCALGKSHPWARVVRAIGTSTGRMGRLAPERLA